MVLKNPADGGRNRFKLNLRNFGHLEQLQTTFVSQIQLWIDEKSPMVNITILEGQPDFATSRDVIFKFRFSQLRLRNEEGFLLTRIFDGCGDN